MTQVSVDSFHGGGFVLDYFDLDDTLCSIVVKAANCVVVSVDWRLPPENPFPAGLEDCFASPALRFAWQIVQVVVK